MSFHSCMPFKRSITPSWTRCMIVASTLTMGYLDRYHGGPALPKSTVNALIVMAVALLLSYLICNVGLKNLVSRDRPFWIDERVILKVEEPPDFSFPSGHTFSSFAAAVTLFIYSRKMGIAALALALTIAFSRLYLFLHFPSDVLFPIVFSGCDRRTCDHFS